MLHVLTIGKETFVADPRFSSAWKKPGPEGGDWRLRIHPTQAGDGGTYLCQISTHPPTLLVTHLQVIGEQYAIQTCVKASRRTKLPNFFTLFSEASAASASRVFSKKRRCLYLQYRGSFQSMRTACKAVVSGRSITSLAPLLTSIALSTTTYPTSKASFGHTMGIPSPKIRTVEVSGMCHTRGVSFGKIIFLKWSSAL